MLRHRPFVLIAVLALVVTLACRKEAPPLTEVAAFPSTTLPADPGDRAWSEVQPFVAELLLQDLVEPRLLTPSTATIEVRALTDGREVAFHLTWSDETRDDLPRAATFPDGCAVQVPTAAGADLPAPQMGEPDRPVEIAYWRASWQAWVDGRVDQISSLYPNAHPDHYPFTAPSLGEGSEEQQAMAERYAPARALGNLMEGPRAAAVENLVAEGPGTLRPDPEGRSRGAGVRTPSGWAVVIVRPLPEGLSTGHRGQVAFAVWDGAHQETGSRKMRTGWVPLALSEAR